MRRSCARSCTTLSALSRKWQRRRHGECTRPRSCCHGAKTGRIDAMNTAIPRILSIAGSDSCGGAGIQADIKTATALGAYAMTAITAVTAQDTTGVRAVQLMSAELVRAQIIACLSDIGADAIKIGMLGSAAIALAVFDALHEQARGIPIVLDPIF